MGEIGKDYNITNKDIINITEFIKNSTSCIDRLLTLDKESKNNIADEINKYKNNIISSYETFCSYLNQYNILLFLMEDISLQKYLNENHIHNIDFNKFFEDCYKFLKNSASEAEKKYKISQILMYLPLKMSNDEYIEYVKKSIMNQKDSINLDFSTYLNLLKQKFNPTLVAEYKSLFPDLIDEIDSYILLLNEPITQDKLENISKGIDIIQNKLFDVSEYLNILYKNLNYLLLLLSMGLDMDFIIGTNPVYLDLYNTVKSILNNNNKDKQFYSETIIDLLNKHLEQIMNIQTKINNDLDKIIVEADNIYDNELIDGLIDTNNMFRTYINIDLKNEIYNVTEKNNSDMNVDEFIKFLSDEINQNNYQLKIRMKSFLGVIPSVFNQSEAMNYIESSILDSKSYKESLLAISQIGNKIF